MGREIIFQGCDDTEDLQNKYIFNCVTEMYFYNKIILIILCLKLSPL